MRDDHWSARRAACAAANSPSASSVSATTTLRQRRCRRRDATSSARGAARLGLGHDVVAVEMLAAQGHEQGARRRWHRAGIGGHRVDQHVGADAGGLRIHCAMRREQHRPHARASSSSARATASVVERMLHAGDFLVGLVALAGDQHDVAGAGALRCARAIAAARSRCTIDAHRGRRSRPGCRRRWRRHPRCADCRR